MTTIRTSTNMSSTCKKKCRPEEENQFHANLSLPHSPSLFAHSSSDDILNPQHCQADYSRREWLFPNRRVSKLSISLETETESMENEEADSNNNREQQRKRRKKVRFDRICERVEWDNFYCDAPPPTARDQRKILEEWDERATAALAGRDEEGEEVEMVAKEENGLCLAKIIPTRRIPSNPPLLPPILISSNKKDKMFSKREKIDIIRYNNTPQMFRLMSPLGRIKM
uniref:Uncharacterized protein n=1 Tax=Globodera rostochiensis TaxID=31243 RepID=A0A914GQZ0_GLORO